MAGSPTEVLHSLLLCRLLGWAFSAFSAFPKGAAVWGFSGSLAKTQTPRPHPGEWPGSVISKYLGWFCPGSPTTTQKTWMGYRVSTGIWGRGSSSCRKCMLNE